MPFADIRPAVKAVLEAVDGVGVVSDFEPWVRRLEELKTFFQPENEDALRGWTISRESVVESYGSLSRGEAEARHAVVIRGYMSVSQQGATERTFQDLVDTVTAALLAQSLDDAKFNQTVDYVEPPIVRAIEHREFSNDFVHYCEIVVGCRERVAVAA
jgi:hypothetical protein